jgi:hypothetical protein
MPSCASASDRQSPTGPAPITITRLEVLSIQRATNSVTMWHFPF